MRNKRNLPRNITKFNGKKETTLELHIKNVMTFDSTLANLISNVIKAEEKFENTNFDEIPF